jgi:hypothetical protein
MTMPRSRISSSDSGREVRLASYSLLLRQRGIGDP